MATAYVYAFPSPLRGCGPLTPPRRPKGIGACKNAFSVYKKTQGMKSHFIPSSSFLLERGPFCARVFTPTWGFYYEGRRQSQSLDCRLSTITRWRLKSLPHSPENPVPDKPTLKWLHVSATLLQSPSKDLLAVSLQRSIADGESSNPDEKTLNTVSERNKETDKKRRLNGFEDPDIH